MNHLCRGNYNLYERENFVQTPLKTKLTFLVLCKLLLLLLFWKCEVLRSKISLFLYFLCILRLYYINFFFLFNLIFHLKMKTFSPANRFDFYSPLRSVIHDRLGHHSTEQTHLSKSPRSPMLLNFILLIFIPLDRCFYWSINISTMYFWSMSIYISGCSADIG